MEQGMCRGTCRWITTYIAIKSRRPWQGRGPLLPDRERLIHSLFWSRNERTLCSLSGTSWELGMILSNFSSIQDEQSLPSRRHARRHYSTPYTENLPTRQGVHLVRSVAHRFPWWQRVDLSRRPDP